MSDKDNKQIAFFEQFGRNQVAPFLVAYIDWLQRVSEQDKVTKLLFMSRDGYLPQRAYQLLVSPVRQLPNTYMYASRRLLNIPAIEKFDRARLTSLTSDKPLMPVADYMRRIGLRPGLYLEQIREAGFLSDKDLVRSPRDIRRLKILLKHLEPEFLKLAADERKIVLTYLDSLGLRQDEERIGLVDIGWHGSMQRSVQHLIGDGNHTRYYYFGLHKNLTDSQIYPRSAFLDESIEPRLYAQTVRRCMELFEISFAEPVSTIVGMRVLPSGNFEPVYSDTSPDTSFVAAITAIQRGALGNLKAFRDISLHEALQPMKRLLNNPTHTEAMFLGNLLHHEGIADIGTSAALARPKLSRKEYSYHPVRLFFDWHQSFWPKGFAVRYRQHE